MIIIEIAEHDPSQRSVGDEGLDQVDEAPSLVLVVGAEPEPRLVDLTLVGNVATDRAELLTQVIFIEASLQKQVVVGIDCVLTTP